MPRRPRTSRTATKLKKIELHFKSTLTMLRAYLGIGAVFNGVILLYLFTVAAGLRADPEILLRLRVLYGTTCGIYLLGAIFIRWAPKRLCLVALAAFAVQVGFEAWWMPELVLDPRSFLCYLKVVTGFALVQGLRTSAKFERLKRKYKVQLAREQGDDEETPAERTPDA